jgi:hypothetical protein
VRQGLHLPLQHPLPLEHALRPGFMNFNFGRTIFGQTSIPDFRTHFIQKITYINLGTLLVLWTIIRYYL